MDTICTRTVLSDEDYLIQLHDSPFNCKGLIVSFFSVHLQDNEGYGLAGRFLTAQGYDVLSVKPRSANWYLDFAENDVRVQLVREIGSKYKNVFGYGISMGAFGALFLQDLLLIPRVASISARLPVDAITISKMAAEQTKNFDLKLRIRPENFYVYDSLCVKDEIFAAAEVGKCNVFDFKAAGHPVSAALKALGKLKELSAGLIAFDRSELIRLIDFWTLNKERTTQYFVSCASEAFRQKDFQSAINCFKAAQEIDKFDMSFYGLWSEILYLTGDSDSAIAILLELRSTKLWSGDASARLAYYFYKNGNEPTAKKYMIEAIVLDPRQLVVSEFAKKLGIRSEDISF